MPTAVNSDTQLVEWSLTGDRNAFRQIVERYQSLVCSITYNATGSLTLSEDLAQDTFVAAWKQLSELREPAHLRAWLCGITRFLVGKELRRQGREPIHAAESLEAIHDPPSPEPSPSSQAVTREEEAILWRALERIPDAYRQPLILFYREQQSVERVAIELDLTEDAVKQRLSRGRKLLHEEVIAFVEGTLTRTAPGQEFSSAVLAALPMAAASAATATAGATAKGTAAAKSGFLAASLATLAPFIGIVGGIASQWLVVRATTDARERRLQKIWFTVFWIFILVWCVPAKSAMKSLSQHFEWSDRTFFAAMAGFWWFYAAVAATWTVAWFRHRLAFYQQTEQTIGTPRPAITPMATGTRAGMLTGLYLAFFSWLVYLAWQENDRIAAVIITGTMLALGLWHFFDVQGKTGMAAIRAGIGHFVLGCGVVLGILNLRWAAWLASRHECSLAEIHRLLPAWVLPVLTVALVLWVGLILALTRPTRRPTPR
jgi:RNA polymerase sigma factor (sigma-70 family)